MQSSPETADTGPAIRGRRHWHWPGAAVLAAIVTGGLFALMYYFTSAGGGGALARLEQPLTLDFVRLEHSTEVIEKTRVLPPKPKTAQQPAQQPRVSPQPSRSLQALAPPNLRAPSYVPGVDGALDAFAFAFAGEREVVPLARVSPVYPPRAVRRGIEGWVRIALTIDEHGHVAEPRVIAADPENIFDRAALSAISRWRYQPQLIDGQAIRRSGVEVTVHFQLSKE